MQTAPLGPWMALIFLMADGQNTIEEIHSHLAKQYRGNIPSDYKRTVDSVLKRLLESKVIGLSEKKCRFRHIYLHPMMLKTRKNR